MKTIEVDDELYRFIASQTQDIGESASDILRRLLLGSPSDDQPVADHKAFQYPVRDCQIGITNDTEQDHGAIYHTGGTENTDKVKVIRTLLISDEFATKVKAIDRFMLILSSLYHIDVNAFSKAVTADVKGRTRVYFADNQATLLASGKTTKPRSIPKTPFWVITNTNTNRKRQMVQQLMTKMGFQSDLIEKVCHAI